MSTRTVAWTVPPAPLTGTRAAEGLRERKKRLMRQQLSDTATLMFLERGFDAVRVAEVAEACGVSEKTVFNYFPTKESLILDRLEATIASLRTGLAEPGVTPVQAALRILDRELGAMTSWLAAQEDPARAGATIRRFGVLIQDTPSLRAFQSDTMDQFTAVAAEILADRARCCVPQCFRSFQDWGVVPMNGVAVQACWGLTNSLNWPNKTLCSARLL